MSQVLSVCKVGETWMQHTALSFSSCPGHGKKGWKLAKDKLDISQPKIRGENEVYIGSFEKTDYHTVTQNSSLQSHSELKLIIGSIIIITYHYTHTRNCVACDMIPAKEGWTVNHESSELWKCIACDMVTFFTWMDFFDMMGSPAYWDY